MKYSTDIVDEICGYLRNGALEIDSALLAGISKSTYLKWKAENETFRTMVERALADYRHAMLAIIHKQVAGGDAGQMALNILARRWPKDFAQSQRIWLSSDDGEKDELKEIIDIIKRATPQPEDVVEGEVVSEKPEDAKQISASSQQTVQE